MLEEEEREKIQEPGWESRVNIYACRRREQVWELLPGGGKHNSGGLFCQVYGVIPVSCVYGCEFRNKSLVAQKPQGMCCEAGQGVKFRTPQP